MAWKDVLNKDLGEFFGRRPAPDRTGDEPVYWWAALWRFVTRQRVLESEALTDALQKHARYPGWKGPVYWNARAWRRDVVLVIEQMRSLIGCNVPLAPGLAAAAREEVRIRRSWTPGRVTRLFGTAVAAGLFVVVGIGIAADPEGFENSNTMAMGVIMAVFAVIIIRETALNRRSRTGIYLALEQRIAEGRSLSEAMGTLPRFFPRHLTDLVEAGETAGNLERAFDQFGDSMLRSISLHRELRLTLLYVKVVLFLQLGIVAFILVKVLPIFSEILREITPDGSADYADATMASVPGLAVVVPGLPVIQTWGNYLIEWGPPILAAIAGYGAWRLVSRFRRRRHWASRGTSSILLLVPWFRGLVVRDNLGLIAMMLQGLLRAGVPLDRALALAADSDLLPAYRQWLGALRERIQQGDSLRDALDRTRPRRLVPDSFCGLLEAGERSGELPAMLERIATLYRRDTEKRVHVLAALVLPAGVFFMGYVTLCMQAMVFGTMVTIAEQLIV